MMQNVCETDITALNAVLYRFCIEERPDDNLRELCAIDCLVRPKRTVVVPLNDALFLQVLDGILRQMPPDIPQCSVTDARQQDCEENYSSGETPASHRYVVYAFPSGKKIVESTAKSCFR
jgi:hypothetical protein